MKIASFADIAFEVSEKKALVFRNFERKRSGRWEDHDVIGEKPVPEFLGPGQDELTLEVVLRAELGINPAKELKKLEKIVEKGTAYFFMMGEKPISKNKFYLESYTETHEIIDNRGNSLGVVVTLNLREYANPNKKRK